MRIRRTCRLQFPSHFQTAAVWFGVFAATAGLIFPPALGQGPPGAAAAATGAAAAATAAAAAPAPKRSAASAATAAVMGNSGRTRAKSNDSSSPQATEVAADGAALAGNPGTSEPAAPAAPLTGVAAQCANLLKMATSLKAEVDKTNKDVLSVAVVRDADQIERMAKKIREQQH